MICFHAIAQMICVRHLFNQWKALKLQNSNKERMRMRSSKRPSKRSSKVTIKINLLSEKKLIPYVYCDMCVWCLVTFETYFSGLVIVHGEAHSYLCVMFHLFYRQGILTGVSIRALFVPWDSLWIRFWRCTRKLHPP